MILVYELLNNLSNRIYKSKLGIYIQKKIRKLLKKSFSKYEFELIFYQSPFSTVENNDWSTKTAHGQFFSIQFLIKSYNTTFISTDQCFLYTVQTQIISHSSYCNNFILWMYYVHLLAAYYMYKYNHSRYRYKSVSRICRLIVILIVQSIKYQNNQTKISLSTQYAARDCSMTSACSSVVAC